MSKPTWIGKKLGGRYLIQELLGQGGMSAVYKAMDENLNRVVAVKLIHPHLSADAEFVRRFEEEAKAVAQLRHPNIIQVFDFDNDGDVYYIVFEFVPGETLQSRLTRLHDAGRRMEMERVLHVGAGIADALAYAHSRGLIHRDVKPANVMLNVNNEPVLMDFGIVKIMGGTQHTATGAVMGTARYMSPEQIRGERIDERTDLYSLGIILFEMAGGRVPFEADSTMTVLMMHVNDPVPDLRKLRPDVPPALVSVINDALAKGRDERFKMAADMAAQLRAIDPEAPAATEATIVEPPPEKIEPETAAPTTRDRGAATAPPAGGAGGTPAPVGPPPPHEAAPPADRRRLAIIGGIAALLILVCVVGAGIIFASGLLGGGDGEEGTPAAALDGTPEPGDGDGEEIGVSARASETPAEATATATTAPSPTPSNTPTATNTRPPTATSPPTMTPTPTIPPGIPYYSRINDITVDGGRYVVEYETFDFTETLPGMHVHFFFDTVPPEQAGVPGNGPWILYGGPRPFTQYTVADRPQAAEQMCILVANPDHSVQADSGNCYPLPMPES